MSNFLAGLLVVVWVLSWWGPRRFRLWLVMLAPFGSVALIVAAYLSVPAGSCDHGCVLGWANNVDSSRSLAAALPTFPVAVVIAALTLPVELLLFLRRNPTARTPDASLPAWTATDQNPTQPTDNAPSRTPADQAPSRTPTDYAPPPTPAGHAPSPPPAGQEPSWTPADHAPSWTPADHAPSWGDLTRRPHRGDRKPAE